MWHCHLSASEFLPGFKIMAEFNPPGIVCPGETLGRTRTLHNAGSVLRPLDGTL